MCQEQRQLVSVFVTLFLMFGCSGGLVQRGRDFQRGALRPSDQRVEDGGFHEQEALWCWGQRPG